MRRRMPYGRYQSGVSETEGKAREDRAFFRDGKMMRVVEELGVDNLKIVQDTELYRFTSDSVLLSRFVRAKKGERVADFCAGCGIVGLHFYAENKGAESVTFFEMQPELAALNRETLTLNGLDFCVENMRVQEIPASYTEHFSLVLCNPPYETGGFENANPQKAPCRKELTLSLEELANSAKRCLKFGGRFVLCHRADRAADVIYACRSAGLEPKKMQFVSGKRGAKPYLMLLACTKGGKAGMEILPEAVNEKNEAVI